MRKVMNFVDFTLQGELGKKLAKPQGLNPFLKDVNLSGIGGINTWRDALEFIQLGCHNVQVCTAVMENGYRIIDDLILGLQAQGCGNQVCWMRTLQSGVPLWRHLTLKASPQEALDISRVKSGSPARSGRLAL